MLSLENRELRDLEARLWRFLGQSWSVLAVITKVLQTGKFTKHIDTSQCWGSQVLRSRYGIW